MYYPIPLAVAMFLAVAGLLMLAFFLYQAYMISQGCTTYETYKRNLVHRQMTAAAAQQAGTADSSVSNHQHLRRKTSRGWQSLWLSKFGWQRIQAANVGLPSSPYDKGFWQNWREVIYPDQALQQCQQQSQRRFQTPSSQGSAVPAGSMNGRKKQR